MRNIIKTIQKNRAERRELLRKLDGLTDPHLLTVATFARNFELNTSRPATAAECQEVRTLLCQR